MRRIRAIWPPALGALAVLALAAAPAAADDHEPIRHQKIRVKKLVHDCQGDDCDEVEHRRVIVLGDDGEVHEIGGDVMKRLGYGGAYAFSTAHHGQGGFLGVATTELTPELRRHFGVPEDAGVLVARVVEDSAAALAGVQVGDVLTAVGDEAVETTGDLLRAVSGLDPGSAVDLELWRDGAMQTLGATLGERPMPHRHAMLLHCEDGEEDCPQIAGLGDLDCGDDADCEVRIECKDGDCRCTVNGEPTECETLPGFAEPGE